MRALPRGVNDHAVLNKLDVWALERFLSLAVMRRSTSSTELQQDVDA